MKESLSEDMRTAAEWLDCNEGGEGESEACKRVADWLRKRAEQLDRDWLIRKVVKETGATRTRVIKGIDAAVPR